MSSLRPADDLLVPAIRATIGALDLPETDTGLARLAERYGAAIDSATPESQARTLLDLGPKLLSALESMGATPASRARIEKKAEPTSPSGPSELDVMRASRAAESGRSA